MRSANNTKESYETTDDMYDKMLLLGERFLADNLTPIFYIDPKTNNTFIVKFEKAEHGLH